MKRLSFLVLTTVALIGASTSAQAQADTTQGKVNLIKQLMIKTHMRTLAAQAMQGVMQTLQQPTEDPKEAELKTALVQAFSLKTDSLVGAMIDSIIPIYAKYYTYYELQDLVKLYDLPIMQRTLEVTPAIMNESMAVGSHLGQEVMEGIITDYIAGHPDLMGDEKAPVEETPKQKAKSKKK